MRRNTNPVNGPKRIADPVAINAVDRMPDVDLAVNSAVDRMPSVVPVAINVVDRMPGVGPVTNSAADVETSGV